MMILGIRLKESMMIMLDHLFEANHCFRKEHNLKIRGEWALRLILFLYGATPNEKSDFRGS